MQRAVVWIRWYQYISRCLFGRTSTGRARALGGRKTEGETTDLFPVDIVHVRFRQLHISGRERFANDLQGTKHLEDARVKPRNCNTEPDSVACKEIFHHVSGPVAKRACLDSSLTQKLQW